MSNKTITLIWVIFSLLIIVGFGYYFVVHKELSNNQKVEITQKEVPQYSIDLTKPEKPPVDIPEPSTFGNTRPGEWDTYWSNEWKMGLRFPYYWSLSEEYGYQYAFDRKNKPLITINELRKTLQGVSLRGMEGCSIKIDKTGGEVSADWTTGDRVVDGYNAKTWEHYDGEKYSLIISLQKSAEIPQEHRVILRINSSLNEGRIICDQILSTIKFF